MTFSKLCGKCNALVDTQSWENTHNSLGMVMLFTLVSLNCIFSPNEKSSDEGAPSESQFLMHGSAVFVPPEP